MMRVILLSAVLLLAGVAFLPEAAAECEPLADPEHCSSTVDEVVGEIGPTVTGIRERGERIIDDAVPERCYDTPQGIRCEY